MKFSTVLNSESRVTVPFFFACIHACEINQIAVSSLPNFFTADCSCFQPVPEKTESEKFAFILSFACFKYNEQSAAVALFVGTFIFLVCCLSHFGKKRPKK